MLQASPTQPCWHVHRPSPVLPSLQTPWPLQGFSELPAHSRVQFGSAQPLKQTQSLFRLSPCEHSNPQAGPYQPLSHTAQLSPPQCGSQSQPASTWRQLPWPVHGSDLPPRHSKSHAGPAKPEMHTHCPSPAAPSLQNPWLLQVCPSAPPWGHATPQTAPA